MPTDTLDPLALADLLRADDGPFSLGRKDQPEADPLHRDSYDQDAELYALATTVSGIPENARARGLLTLLGQSRDGYAPKVRRTLERVTAFHLHTLPVGMVLTVFLALRRLRANHKHATKAVLGYLSSHPGLPSLARTRRPSLVDVIEHALGRDVARASARDEALRVKHFTKFEPLAAILPWLYKKGPAPEGNFDPSTWHERFAEPAAPELPKTITATNRGEISSILVHMYRGGSTKELLGSLGETADRVAASLPRFDGSVSVVLDASASTRGYGEREHCCLSQSVAFTLVLERCCARLRVHLAGGHGEAPLPRPEGSTDLAGPLLDALEDEPDVVLILSDGYENHGQGDTHSVLSALPSAGVTTPVVIGHSKFSSKDDLALRRIATGVPELEIWHESDFEDALLALVKHARAGRDFVRETLLSRLGKREALWTS